MEEEFKDWNFVNIQGLFDIWVLRISPDLKKLVWRDDSHINNLSKERKDNIEMDLIKSQLYKPE